MNLKTNMFNHPLIYKALLTATKHHSGKFRKGREKIPYITHPTMVAFIVQKYTQDTNTICAALLHDLIEDTKYTFAEMETDFNSEIVQIVDGVTEVEFKNRKKSSWQERKNNYLMKLESAPIESSFVSAADHIHNLHTLILMHREIGDKIWSYFKDSSPEERLDFYQKRFNIISEKIDDNEIITEYQKILTEYQNL